MKNPYNLKACGKLRLFTQGLLTAFVVFVATIGEALAAPESLVQSVTYNGENITMRLTKQSLRGVNFELWAHNSSGTYDVITPVEERSYIGTVDEYSDAVSCGILQDDGTFRGAVYFDRGVTWRTLGNAVEGTQATGYAPDQFTAYNYPSSSTVDAGQGGTTMYGFDLGIDAEYTYFSMPGQSSVAKTFELIEYNICLTRAQYMRDVMLRPYLGRVIIRTDQDLDPYKGLGGGGYLGTVRNHWNDNHTDANSDLVAGVSVWSVGGGLAWVGVVGTSSGYSVNDSGTSGSFDVVFRHEMGHNWNCGHYVGGSPEGTGFMGGNATGRMSGCEVHNVLDHRAHKIASGIVDSEGSYSAVNLPPYASMDVVNYTQVLDAGTVIDVLANDHDGNGQSLSLLAFDSVSAQGGTVTQQGQGLVYTPNGTFNGDDYFKYEIQDSSGQTATGVVIVRVSIDYSLQLHLSLDETSGTAAENHAFQGSDGTLEGTDFSTASVTGKFGNAVDLDGVDDRVASTNISVNSNTVTITGWIKQGNTQNSMSGVLFGRNSGVATGLHMGTNRELRYTWNNENWTWDSGLVPPADTWTFVALVVEPTQATIYMNPGTGFQSAVNVNAHAAASFAGTFYVGWDSLDTARHFLGSADDVRIYDESLSQADLQKVYEGGAVGVPSPYDMASGVKYGGLSWSPSSSATSYEVYVGTNQSAVSSATTSSTEYQGATSQEAFYFQGLQANTTYFWRVDAVTASGTVTGEVWSFTSASAVEEFPGTLVTHLTMDDADVSGSIITDVSGAPQCDGTITGATTGHPGKIGQALDVNAGSDRVALDATCFSGVSGQISVSLWINGAETQPRGDGVLGASDSSGNRVLNIHAPWSDSYVYWDAGNSGSSSYDRMIAGAQAADFKGQWNHWVFTKDTTTGLMKIYLNGRLHASGGGYTRTMDGIASIMLGQDSGGGSYDGLIDDFAVWSSVLDADTVKGIYLRGVSGISFSDELNSAPVANDAAFSVAENVAVGTAVGTVSASDPDAGDTLSYTITAGNTGGAFAIDTNTGAITTAAAIDYEIVSSYSLTVTVTDNGGLTDTATITVTVNDVAVEDADGDGVTDAVEIVLGTDPNSAASTPGSHYTDLVGWWRLNEASGTVAADDSGYANDGTVTGASVVSGVDSNARDLNGSSGSVSLGNPAGLDVTGEITMSAWIKPEASNGIRNVLAHGYSTSPNSEVFLRVNNGVYEVGSWSGSNAIASGGDASADLNTWVHLAGVYDGTHWRLYRNGVEIANLETAQGALSVNANWAIGSTGSGSERFFDGALDDVRLYGRGLNAAEISSLYDEHANQAPVASDASFAIDENATAGTVVGTVSASDPDTGDTLSYAITAGNSGGEFVINSSTGIITTTVPLDHEYVDQYVLTIEVSDGELTDAATITVNVNDLNEAPVPNLVFGSVLENAPIGTSVVTVTGLDQDAGDSISYAIIGGNDGSFAINSTTGEITTIALLDFETTASYNLLVELTDNGGLTAQTTVGINVGNVLEVTTSYTSNAEAMIDGQIISGTLADTQTSNNVYEVLQEAKTSGRPSSRVSSLEHTWSFDIGAGGILAELSVEAFHSVNNEGDDFVFSYSTDGLNFTDLITVTKTADDNTAQIAPLPAGVTGTVYIRVRDTDRTTGNGGQDTISIDHLSIEVIE